MGDLVGVALRGVSVFVSVVVGLLLARFLLGRLEGVVRPVSRWVGVPVSLLALSVVEARAPHVVLAEAYRSGVVGFRHILQFSFATWPLRVVLLHLRIGVIPIAVGALGVLGAVYLGLVYLSSLVGFLVALRLRVGWPDLSGGVSRVVSVGVWRPAASLTAKYLVFELVFFLLGLLGVGFSLGWLPLSPEAVAVASISAFRPTYGIMAAAPAYFGGRLDAFEVLVALLVGRLVFMSVFEFPRSAVQFYGSIYPAGVAGRLVAYTAAVLYGTTVPVVLLLMALRWVFK